MLVLQLLMLWVSAYNIATSSPKRSWRITIPIIFFAAPFVQNFAGYIVKDAQMGLSWLLAASIMIRSYAVKERPNVLLSVLIALLLLYGTWLRHNAITGLITMCLLWAWTVLPHKPVRQRLLSALGLLVLLFAGGKAFDNAVVTKKMYPETLMYLQDLAGLQVRSHINAFPAAMYSRPGFDTAYLTQHYHPSTADHLMWNPDNKVFIDRSDEEAIMLREAWLKAIQAYPAEYLKNRWQTFAYFLRIKDNTTKVQYYFPWIQPNNYGISINEGNPLYHGYKKYMNVFEGLFIFKPWFWAVVNLLLFVFIPFIKDKGYRFIYICLASSSLLYFLPQFLFVMNDIDFRYIYWVCLACMLAVMVGLLGRKSTAKS